MDAKGARDLAKRIGSNGELAARAAPADVPAGSLPLYRWVGGAAPAPAIESSPLARRLTPRWFRVRGR